MHLYSAFLVALLPAFTAAHGYLSSPPPRGIEYVSTNVDRLKSPNFGNKVCRGEPAGQITQVKPGGSVTLDFTITAPHVGPCTVYLLDLDLDESKQVKIASMNDCAAPGKVAPWTIKLPLNQFGRKVLRWYWEASHNTPHEPYEQCVDLMIGAIDVNSKGGVTLYTSDKKADEPKMTAQSLPSPPQPKSMSRGYSMPPPARRRPMPPPRPIMPPMNDYAPAQPDYSDAAPEAYDNGPVDAGYDAAGAEPDRMDSYAGEEVSSAGSCENGRYTCNADGSFSVCNNGEQVVQQCGPGQMCAPFNDSIQCVLSSSAEDY